MGALIGRRGETIESPVPTWPAWSSTAWKAPRKAGPGCGRLRSKTRMIFLPWQKRIADRVIRTGCYYEMEPMNPYERHIIPPLSRTLRVFAARARAEGPPTTS